jgi:pimeloyl-ACP methyl ester carboxylesterase
MRMTYRWHAIPLLARPSEERMRRFLAWETDGAPLHMAWTEVMCLGAEARTSRLVLPRRPTDDALRSMAMPTLLVLAERSKQLDVAATEANARRLVPRIVTTVLPGATHHTIPTVDAERLNKEVLAFLAARP